MGGSSSKKKEVRKEERHTRSSDSVTPNSRLSSLASEPGISNIPGPTSYTARYIKSDEKPTQAHEAITLDFPFNRPPPLNDFKSVINTLSQSTTSSSISKGPVSENSSSSIDQLAVQFTTSLSLDDQSILEKGVVVGHVDKYVRIIQTLPVAGESEWLFIDDKSTNLTAQSPTNLKNLPEIHTFIKIKKKSLCTKIIHLHCTYHVDEYIIVEPANQPIGEHLVAIVDIFVGALSVIGNNFVVPTLVPNYGFTKAVQPGDFVIGNVHRLQPFFSPVIMDNVVCYVKNLKAERDYLADMERHKSNRQIMSAPRTPDKMFYMTAVRTLYADELSQIANNCCDLETVSLEEAKLYIRDVYIAVARLEKFTRLKSIEKHTIQVEGTTYIDYTGANARFTLAVRLSETDTDNVIRVKSQDTWRVGSDLSIRHPELERYCFKNGDLSKKTYEAGMTIERINFEGRACSVQFRPHPRSYDLFDVLASSKIKLEGVFTIGPSEDFVETIAQALESKNFENFVINRPLFDAWRGIKQDKRTAFYNLTKPFDVKGTRLDPSQTAALRAAVQNPGFTCIEAPPGSGKTFLIAALVAAKYEECGPKSGSICISATTNNAISNAIDKTHECFPKLKKTREYSKKMEGEISGRSKEISLREMALNAGKYIDVNSHKGVGKAIENFNTCKQNIRTVENFQKGLTLLDELQSADFALRASFTAAYQPYVMGTTCELVARRGDAIYDRAKNMKDREKDDLLQYAITHLILDEASQLPPHLALAVYVMLPGLKQITLIGDSEQLGPYTPLEDKTFAYKMVGAGELHRIGIRNDFIRVHLKTVYRSHPKIVDLLLSPIYGADLKAGLRAEHRSLAYEKDLPCAQDEHRTPVLFVNVENAINDKRGVNEKELNVVLDFINTLKQKGVTGEDVAVVCNHHAQREALLSSLKGKGSIGALNTSVGIYTIDSFQGKEAKVVLILTTKVSLNSNTAKFTFQFVANPNRGCVAVSRGQHAVYLFGEWFNLVTTEFWSKFVPGIVESRAMVNSEWKPANVDEYHRLKITTELSAPKKPLIKNEHIGGRGVQKNKMRISSIYCLDEVKIEDGALKKPVVTNEPIKDKEDQENEIQAPSIYSLNEVKKKEGVPKETIIKNQYIGGRGAQKKKTGISRIRHLNGVKKQSGAPKKHVLKTQHVGERGAQENKIQAPSIYFPSFSSASVPFGGGVDYSRPLASLVLRNEVETSIYAGCSADSLPICLSRGSFAEAPSIYCQNGVKIQNGPPKKSVIKNQHIKRRRTQKKKTGVPNIHHLNGVNVHEGALKQPVVKNEHAEGREIQNNRPLAANIHHPNGVKKQDGAPKKTVIKNQRAGRRETQKIKIQAPNIYHLNRVNVHEGALKKPVVKNEHVGGREIQNNKPQAPSIHHPNEVKKKDGARNQQRPRPKKN